VGSDFPAMPREGPAGRTLRAMGLADDVLDGITWHNGFRFLGVSEPKGRGEHSVTERGEHSVTERGEHSVSEPEASGKHGTDAATLSSSDELGV
jgi:hypothetical protein